MGTMSPTPSSSDNKDTVHTAPVHGHALSRVEALLPRRHQPSPLAGPSAPIGAHNNTGVALASGVDVATRTSDVVAKFALSLFNNRKEGRPPARQEAVGALTRYLAAPQGHEDFALVRAKGELSMGLWQLSEHNYNTDLKHLHPLAKSAVKRMIACG
jgi:hypothetical protein